MLDNTDSDVLTLLPKNGQPKAPEPAAPVAFSATDDEDDALGFSSPQTQTPPPQAAEAAAEPKRSVPRLTVPPKLTIPGQRAVPQPTPPPTVQPAAPQAAEASQEAQGQKKVLFNVTPPPPKPVKPSAPANPTGDKDDDDEEDFTVHRPAGSAEEFLQIGQTVGQYTVKERLHTKGHFLRYRIFHNKLQVYRELQLLNPQVIREKENLPTYFMERVSKFSTLPHPNLRNILYVINDPKNNFFGVVLEAVQEGTLADDPEFGKMPIEKAKRIIIAVATALSYFELVGVTHNSIHARNITRSENGHDIKLDGLMDAYSGGSGLQGGNIQGIQRDLLNAGALFYEMLTGQQPPLQNSHKTTSFDPREHAPEIPGDVALLIIRLLVPTAMTRFSSATDFLLSAQALTSTQNSLLTRQISPNRQVARILKDFSIWKAAVVLLAFIAGTQLLRYIDNCNATAVEIPGYREMQKDYLEKSKQAEENLKGYQELLNEWTKEVKLQARGVK